MQTDARLFNCARCFKQVVICSGCDRGNIYCTKSCATLSRKRSLKTAGNKYQQTKAGKIKHAARQQSYRQKQKKVTHHSSLIPTTNDLLITERSFDLINTSTTSTKQIQCHFCGKFCSVYVRTGFKRDHLRVIQIQNDQKLSQGHKIGDFK